jgi:hypothetical protein
MTGNDRIFTYFCKYIFIPWQLKLVDNQEYIQMTFYALFEKWNYEN